MERADIIRETRKAVQAGREIDRYNLDLLGLNQEVKWTYPGDGEIV